MDQNGEKLIVPHPETGQPIAVDPATVESIALDGDFSDLGEF